MTDKTMKTQQNLITDFVTAASKTTLSSQGAHVRTQKTPQKETGQDVNMRRSPRNVGKDSVVKKLIMSSQKIYPGSGSKPHTRRSYRTPVQTLPLRVDDGKIRRSASKSFTVVPDQEDIDTPRSNIEAFMTVAESEPRTIKTPLEVSKKAISISSLNRSVKTQEQSAYVGHKRSSISAIDVLTPSSKLTPRTNIWNLLQAYDQARTPTVRADDKSQQPSAKTSVSAVRHHKWGQEVTLSPLYQTHTSEDGEESPFASAKSLRRSRKSFHIPALQATASALQSTLKDKAQKSTVGADGQSQQPSAKTPVSAIKHQNWGQEVTLSPMYQTHTSQDGEDSPPISVKSVRRNRQSFHIPISQTTASQNTVSDERQTTATSGDFGIGSAKESLGVMSATVLAKELNTSITSEDVYSNTPGVADDISRLTAGAKVTASGEEECQNNLLAADESEEVDTVSRLSRHEATITHLDMAHDINKPRHAESATHDTNQDVVNKELAHAAGILHGDVGTSSKEDRNITIAQGIKNVEENPNDHQESLRKEKSFGGNRTSLSSKHGEIYFSISPKKSSKSSKSSPVPNSSVYDLSDASSSSGNFVPRQRNSSKSPEKGSASKKRSASKGRPSATENFRRSLSSDKKSLVRYSEWKLLLPGNDITGQSSSFLNIPPRLSSTPLDRTKRIFHSTRMHNSITSRESDEQASFMVDAASNISPIRRDGRNHEQTGMMTRQEMIAMDVDKGSDRGDGGYLEDRERAFLTQTEGQAEADPESVSDESLGLSPLATPHIDMDKRRQAVPSVGKKTVQTFFVGREASGSTRKRKRDKAEVGRQPGKRTKTNSQFTALPRRSVKFFAERHSTMKLSKDAVEEIEKVSEQFWDNTFKALEAYSLHAGRKIINEQDVILLMKSQRLVSSTEELHDRIREFLPMELRSELIPMAKP